jgi:hypothetical protein
VTRSTLPKGETTDKPYLTDLELEAVRRIDLSDAPRLAPVRDFFVFLCHTVIRLGDSQLLKPENVVGDVVKLMLKRYRKEVAVSLLPQVRSILQSYDFRRPTVSYQKANEYLA